MPQLEHIEAIEKRLWTAADTLRANSNYASNEYFLPVMGLVFLRHAYSRYLMVKDKVAAKLPTRGGKTRALTKEDFSQQGAIFLRPKAQFDHLVALPDSDDRAKAIIEAMESIEADYETLRGVLPKGEYQELDNQVLGQLLRTLNPEELKKVSGDVFGRIYEYFLTQFANQGAHDGGEFFTPVSLVSLIAHVLDPERGTVLDPACGSGGMFVQSARIVEEHGDSPTEKLTFYGLEKNATTIRMAKMNLAVHGLEGDIQKAITYYEDPHELVGKADYVMANPPFNVDEIDADKIKRDPRLPFGLPGVNKKDKVSNGNYVWISYFYSYLNDKGRAGFVMSSQASSAGGGEAKVRRKLVETGDVDAMIAIRSNFFYTRTVPCELWFLNRNKPKAQKDKVLMIDARNVYRKVTRKIYDFSPEQQQNLQAIVWLYRGETDRYLQLLSQYLGNVAEEANACFEVEDDLGQSFHPLSDFSESLIALRQTLAPMLKKTSSLPQGKHPEGHKGQDEGTIKEILQELEKETKQFEHDITQFKNSADQADITDIISQLHLVVNDAIDVRPGEKDYPSSIYDISKIDFDRLRQEFERSPRKNTLAQNLRQAVEQRLQRLLQQNPLRTDFQQHYEQIVAEYNREKDRATIEKTFEALFSLVQELDEEEHRAIREGLDEESLAIFDLLKKPDLSSAEIKRIKAVAVELLEKLKGEKLRVDHWRDKEATRDAVRAAIRDFLWSDETGLPVENYTEADVKTRSENVFRHVYRAYPRVPSPIYEGTWL